LSGLKYRFFWTWDHSANWDLPAIGKQEFGANNRYSKNPETFLRDYKLLIDFMSLHRLNGLIIYGLLRDSHGGIEAARELCRYAKEKEVRILPGVGINSYGGIYYEGDHKYSLNNWLAKHPELRAKTKRPWFEAITACPSKKENIQWHKEAIRWLCENFEIGGINFESGDYGVCQCETCRKRRGEKRDEYMSLEDMSEQYGELFDVAWSVKKDLWLICECYFDNILEPEKFESLKRLSPKTIFQWTINQGYWPKVKEALTKEVVFRLPDGQKVLRTHMGSQWGRPMRKERYMLRAETFAEMCQVVRQAGMDGCTIFGEVSDFNVANEINYLTFEEFSCNPHAEWELFVENNIGAILGGKQLAIGYLKLLDPPGNVESLREAIEETKKALVTVDGEAHRRWIWLANKLYANLFTQLKEGNP